MNPAALAPPISRHPRVTKQGNIPRMKHAESNCGRTMATGLFVISQVLSKPITRASGPPRGIGPLNPWR